MAERGYLLDSNILIYLLRGLSEKVRAKVEAVEIEKIATSAVAYSEVMLGAHALSAEAQARRLFSDIRVLPFDTNASDLYATLPFKRGRLDRLIAAHALSLGLTLVTDNERDFADIPGLVIENWTL